MDDPRADGFSIIRHPLEDDERLAETAVLEDASRDRAASVGAPREAYDAMIARTPFAEGVRFRRSADERARGWWVEPEGASSDRVMLFVHGGAYAVGSAQAYRGFVSQLARRAGVSAFALDYPLAPEHRFPAAYDAVVGCFEWLTTQGVAQTALVGDSAGGGLVLAALSARSAATPPVASVVVFSPWVDLALRGTSFDSGTYDPIFTPERIAGAAATYLNGTDARDGRASPLYRLPASLPPLLIQVGTDELLLDDAKRYAAAAAGRGGEVRLEIFEGLHHVFQRATARLPSARRAVADASAFVADRWL